MKIHDVVQGGEDWQYLRLGRVGGSECASLLVNGQSKTGLGSGAITLICQKVSEIITEELPDIYVSPAMERGIELEPLARREYENENLIKVDEAGYISAGQYFGYSPDGLVGDSGMIEIKCPTGPEYVRYVVTKKIKKEYLAQMNWGLWITGREWCDFVVYNPDFEKKIIVKRIYPDQDIIERFKRITPIYIKSIESVLSVMKA